MIQKTFVVYGFMLLPMPAGGFQWVIYLTHISAIFVGLMDVARFGMTRGAQVAATRRVASGVNPGEVASAEGIAPKTEPPTFGRSAESVDPASSSLLLPGMLIFGGLLGLGVLMYYCGRSHPWTMPNALPAWAFVLMLLVRRVFVGGFSQIRRSPLSWLPAAALGGGYLMCLGYVCIFNSTAEPAGSALKTGIDAYYKYNPRLRQWLKPGEPVLLYMPFGHQMALENGIRDIFPFTQDTNLIGQLDMEIRSLENAGATHALGLFQPEMELKLFDAGFTIRWIDPRDAYTFWEKTGDANDAASNHRKAVDLNLIGNWEQAQVDFRRSIDQNPRDETTHADFASALFDHGDAAGAIAEFRGAVDINPADADAQYNLGILLLMTGRASDAIPPLSAACRLRPGDAAAEQALQSAIAHAQGGI